MLDRSVLQSYVERFFAPKRARVSAAKTRETREEDPIYSYTTDIYFGEGTPRPTPGSAAP